MSDWKVAVHQLQVGDKKDTQSFLDALNQINQHPQLSFLLSPATVPELYALYCKLMAKQSPFSLAIYQNEGGLLVSFFDRFLTASLSFPKGNIAVKCFIRLCVLDMKEGYTERLLQTDVLNYLPVDKLQQLELKTIAQVEAVADLFFKYWDKLEPPEFNLGVDLLLLAESYMLTEGGADHLFNFLQDIIPGFVDRFASVLDKKTLYSEPQRIIGWWMLWKQHYFKTGKDLEPDAPYYQTPFLDIIRYIPAFLWWNNGMTYNRRRRYYQFGTPEFYHLAIGGSIRKGPDPRSYTRRMAKAFVNLPALFNTSQTDMYLYFYGQSLGAGPLLLQLIPRYVRHSEDVEALSLELENWNPIIQKLATPEFEALEPQLAGQLMGYLYHCLRDRPGYSVRGRSLENLCRDTELYLARIAFRAQQRRDREARREAARQARIGANQDTFRWKAHNRIRPVDFQVVGVKYKIMELTNEQMLTHEGRVMKHCVGGYKNKCFSGISSIWSLRQLKDGGWFSLVTIEVVKNRIVQANAACNAVPREDYRGFIESWAKRERLEYGGRC